MRPDVNLVTILVETVQFAIEKKFRSDLLYSALDAVEALSSGGAITDVMRAEVLAADGKSAEAIHLLRGLLRRKPDNLFVKNSLAFLLIQMDMVGGRELLRDVANSQASVGDNYDVELRMISIAKQTLFEVLHESIAPHSLLVNMGEMLRA